MTADSGFWTAGLEDVAEEWGVELLVATERRRHWDTDDRVTEGPPPDGLTEQERMRWKLRTAAGRAVYARRKTVVEPVFGQIKECRGFRRFLLRGLAKVSLEWALLCATHNLLKLYRFQLEPAAA